MSTWSLLLPERTTPRAAAGGAGFLTEAFVAYVLFVSTGAILPLLAMGEGTELAAEDSALLRLTLLPILAVVPILAAAHWRIVLAALLRTPILVVLVGLAVLSVLWSVEPGVTARRALAFAVFSLLGVLIALRYRSRELAERLLWLACAVIAVSVVFQLALPRLATMSDGAWRGAFTHKNVLGQIASFALLVGLVAWRHRLAPRPLLIGLQSLAGLMLPASRSATSLVVTLLLGTAYVLIGGGGLPRLARAAIVSFMFAAAALLGLWLLLFPEDAVALLGRDLTLTGRLPLWEHVLGVIGERPWLGWGFHAIWALPGFADYVLWTLGWAAPNAHSGYLEVLMGLGVLGLGLTLALLGQALLRATRALHRGDPLLGELALLLLGAYLLRNLVESELLQQSSLSWLLVVALLVRAGPVPDGRT